ncbi:MAG TPA: TolC family protein [Planctomycetota bacterium]|nr:TolC family protein [Planctomycetota bacterium]
MSARAWLAAVLLGTCGCAVDEDAEVATYREILDDGLQGRALPADGAPLDVVDAMVLANLRNERLGLEGEAYLQALIERRRAVASFLPTLSVAAVFEREEDTGDRDARTVDVPAVGGLALSPVRDVAALGAAGAFADERRHLLLAAQDALLIDVARTHYEVLRAERAVGVLENALRVQEARVLDAQGRLDAGLIRPLDVSQSRAQAARTSGELVAARARVRTARSLLGFLTAVPLDGRPLRDTLAPPAELPGLEALVAESERRNPRIAAARRRIEAAAKAVESAYGQYFPAVFADLQVFLRRESEPSNVDWTSLIRVSLPLFSAGLIEADVREALSRLRQAKLAESLARRDARRQVETARVDVEAAARRAAELRTEVDAARLALEQAEGLYQAGFATNLERLAAQDQLLSAELLLVEAELDRKIRWLELRRAAGGLHDLPGLRRRVGEDP